MNTARPLTPRMADLIDTLLVQTRRRAIGWTRTDFPGSYAHPSRSGSVIVRGPSPSTFGDLRAPTEYSIHILNSVGDEVDSFTAADGADSGDLKRLVDEVVQQYEQGDPLIDRLRNEVAAAGH
ncbi:hypothetical protein J0H33_16355 [bacterium]|nr:hypothetical protein [bacterium]